ncbi:MAG: hypothetical protein JW902_15595 [Syntrophaceae bacterium]|nr:hypothetical protein [Syntrophaceae bacterium]
MLDSEINELRSPVAVVAHDAGAANLIISWLRDRNDLDLRVSLGGPATRLWHNEFGDVANLSFDEALKGATSLISGTSHSDDREHKARQLARQCGTHSVGVIDHWVNYPERFKWGGIQILPDEIWVADRYAFGIAKQCFPHSTIKQLKNRYMEQVVKAVHRHSRGQKPIMPPARVLYLLEPIRHAWASGGLAGEFQALDFFVQHMNYLGITKATELRLRPHPSDSEGKYLSWMNRSCFLKVTIDPETTLEESIAWADMVLGCETFGLAIAHYAGRPTVSTLPSHAPRCRLPLDSIIHLKDLVTGTGAEN